MNENQRFDFSAPGFSANDGYLKGGPQREVVWVYKNTEKVCRDTKVVPFEREGVTMTFDEHKEKTCLREYPPSGHGRIHDKDMFLYKPPPDDDSDTSSKCCVYSEQQTEMFVKL